MSFAHALQPQNNPIKLKLEQGWASPCRAVDNMNEACMSLRMVLAEPTSCLTLSTGNANMRFSMDVHQLGSQRLRATAKP